MPINLIRFEDGENKVYPFFGTHILFHALLVNQPFGFLGIRVLNLHFDAIGNAVAGVDPRLKGFHDLASVSGRNVAALGVVHFQNSCVLEQLSVDDVCVED